MRPRKFTSASRHRSCKIGGAASSTASARSLGGYVKIPGMHRPAARDLDFRLQHAMRARRELVKPRRAVKRPLAAGTTTRRRRTGRARTGAAARGRRPTEVLTDVRDALAPDAYWRQRAWKKVLVIFAGPGNEPALRVIISRSSCRRRQGDDDMSSACCRTPRRRSMGAAVGDRSSRSTGNRSTRRDIRASSRASRAADHVLVRRDGRTR